MFLLIYVLMKMSFDGQIKELPTAYTYTVYINLLHLHVKIFQLKLLSSF